MASGIEASLEFFAQEPECVELLIQERAKFQARKRPRYFEHREANKGRWEAKFQGVDRRGQSAGRAGRANSGRSWRPHLRNDVCQLFRRLAIVRRKSRPGIFWILP